MTDSMLHRRQSLSAGKEEHGFEVWRTLDWDREGRAQQVPMQGVRSFVGLPQRKDKKHLNAHIGEWLKMRITYGSGAPPTHQWGMCVAMLPNHVQEKMNDRANSYPISNMLLLMSRRRYRAKPIVARLAFMRDNFGRPLAGSTKHLPMPFTTQRQ